MKRILSLPALTLLGVFAFASCDGSNSPVALPDLGPSFAISDATHLDGNQNFYWLPPMVPATTPGGTFDLTATPTVLICDLAAGCGTPIATFTLGDGLRIDDEKFIANWHTDLYAVTPGPTYRIYVFLGDYQIGYADVVFGENGKEAKNLSNDMTIGLVDGRTLPIKFRLEVGAINGALCVLPPSGMVSWWTMDGTFEDIVGDNDPNATSDPDFVDGKVERGVTLTVPTGHIEIPHDASLANAAFTMDAWVRPLGPGGTPDAWGSVIMQQFTNSGTVSTWSLYWSNASGKFRTTVGSIGSYVESSGTYPAGEWYHVAVTFSGTELTLYVNGQDNGSGTFGPVIYIDVPWSIGSTRSFWRNAGWPRTFNGIIDEVEIFDRALSQGEIQAIVDMGGGGKCKL